MDSSLKDRFTSQKVKNAMTPLNWGCGLAELILTGGLCIPNDDWLKACLIVLMFIIVLAYLGAFYYFMLYAPNRLQTEEYNLQVRRMDLLSAANKELPEGQPLEIEADTHQVLTYESQSSEDDAPWASSPSTEE